jgi:hypothetical protein
MPETNVTATYTTYRITLTPYMRIQTDVERANFFSGTVHEKARRNMVSYSEGNMNPRDNCADTPLTSARSDGNVPLELSAQPYSFAPQVLNDTLPALSSRVCRF